MTSELVANLDTEIRKTKKKTVHQIGSAFHPAIEPLENAEFQGSRTRLRTAILLFIDVVAGVIAFVVAYELATLLRLSGYGIPGPLSLVPDLPYVLVVGAVPICVITGLCALWEHYNRRLTFWCEFRDIVKAVVYAAAVLSLVILALKVNISRFWVVSFFTVLVILFPLGRLLSRSLLGSIGIWKKPVIVIGDGRVAFDHAKEACGDAYMGLHIVSYIDITNREQLGNLATRMRYGAEASKNTFGSEYERPHVVVAVENLDNLKRSKVAFDSVMGACAAITLIPPISGIPLYNSQLLQTFRGDVVVLRLHNNLRRKSAKALKRLIDIVLCTSALICISPLMLLIASMVKLDGGPVFYGQQRIGEGGRKFKCLKFRSMDINADEKLRKLLESDVEAKESWEKDHKLRSDPRITKLGNILRKSSLDELPQFWNVLKGEMSLIGPRPIVEAEIDKYGNDFGYYAEAKPGITGLWQISGRNNTSYKERVALDVWYVRNWSPWLDLMIVVKTIPILLVGVGAY